jgi:hypothetical protein
MFLTDDSDLGSTESQPPSTGARCARHCATAVGLAEYALQENIHDITKELSSSPA